MRRRKHDGEGAGHERWLVSYADFITLLFALFVVLFATSQQDKSMPARVAEAVRQALEHGKVDKAKVYAVLGGTVSDAGQGNAQRKGPGGVQKTDPVQRHIDLQDLRAAYERLKDELNDDIAQGRVQIVMEPRGLVISFKQAAVFPSGEDAISSSAYPAIAKVATALSAVPNPVRLEGHTDSVPIHTPRFPSNWDLSAARGIALLEFLSSKHGIARDRMSIAGYAEIAPLADNATEQGRAMNRRVDLVVLNEKGSVSEPGYREKPDRGAKEEARQPAVRPPSS